MKILTRESENAALPNDLQKRTNNWNLKYEKGRFKNETYNNGVMGYIGKY